MKKEHNDFQIHKTIEEGSSVSQRKLSFQMEPNVATVNPAMNRLLQRRFNVWRGADIKFKNYIAIARPDHWFKNVFVLPGTLIAALLTNTPFNQIAWPLFIGLISVCLVASANYVINEWLDAEFDRFHPVKKHRPSVVGNMKASLVYTEYCILSVAGISLASIVSKSFCVAIIALFVMGILYNVKPFRTKDRIYIDVLSESINNPIRLMLGWFIVTSYLLPPISLVLGYWMGGAFLMAIKRYAEFRFINSHKLAGSYRRSFLFYTEEKLLISTFHYALSSAFFLGVFLVKYRLELLLSLPFFPLLFTWYFFIGMRQNSPAQNPEQLYTEKKFLAYAVLLVCVVTSLLFLDLPWLHNLLKTTAFVNQ